MTEKAHMARVARLPCVVCRAYPVQLHHVRKGVGLGQRSSGFRVIPLCPTHHQTGGHGRALHAGQRTFEQNYGTEEELLERTAQWLINFDDVAVL